MIPKPCPCDVLIWSQGKEMGYQTFLLIGFNLSWYKSFHSIIFNPRHATSSSIFLLSQSWWTELPTEMCLWLTMDDSKDCYDQYTTYFINFSSMNLKKMIFLSDSIHSIFKFIERLWTTTSL